MYGQSAALAVTNWVVAEGRLLLALYAVAYLGLGIASLRHVSEYYHDGDSRAVPAWNGALSAAVLSLSLGPVWLLRALAHVCRQE